MPQSQAAERWLSSAPGAAGEHGCEVLAVWRDRGVANRIDPAMERYQPTCRDRSGDGAARVPETGKELPDRDDSMLSLGKLRKAQVLSGWGPRSRFVPHAGIKLDRTRGSPPSEGRWARYAAEDSIQAP